MRRKQKTMLFMAHICPLSYSIFQLLVNNYRLTQLEIDLPNRNRFFKKMLLRTIEIVKDFFNIS